jgi:hypothetical protein
LDEPEGFSLRCSVSEAADADSGTGANKSGGGLQRQSTAANNVHIQGIKTHKAKPAESKAWATNRTVI